MSADYYIIETVREQIIQKGGRIGSTSVSGTFPDNWQYCPCAVSAKCSSGNNRCQVQLGIFLNNPQLGLFVIEVIYLGAKQCGFVRAEDMKLNQLIEKGIIDTTVLKKASF